jgi:hypothetical protein
MRNIYLSVDITLKHNATLDSLENSIVVSYKAKHVLSVWPSSFAPRYLLRNMKTYAQRLVHKYL